MMAPLSLSKHLSLRSQSTFRVSMYVYVCLSVPLPESMSYQGENMEEKGWVVVSTLVFAHPSLIYINIYTHITPYYNPSPLTPHPSDRLFAHYPLPLLYPPAASLSQSRKILLFTSPLQTSSLNPIPHPSC